MVNMPHTNISNEKTFLKDFLVNLKGPLQNWCTLSMNCFLDTTWTVMLSTDSNIQSHSGVLPVAKGLKTFAFGDVSER